MRLPAFCIAEELQLAEYSMDEHVPTWESLHGISKGTRFPHESRCLFRALVPFVNFIICNLKSEG